MSGTSVAAGGRGVDWDAPGMLSIVLQGALFHGNLVETGNACRHWRALFPRAEIALAISVTDVVRGLAGEDGAVRLRLVPRHRDDGHLQAALAAIEESCDRVGLASGALPLPPIKRDTPKANNMNFQIAAARLGLSMIGGRYVMRVRSDLLFLDREFLEQYEAARTVPRGDAAVFRDRVLISWLYTLNPYSFERMPLHFSDWFHFGLAEDIRRIWDVTPVTLQDAMYYRVHPHAEDSNSHERLFNIRLAVEQHLMLHCFQDAVTGLQLDYHNDRRSIVRSLDILVDNFAICDLVAAHCVFEKYSHEFFDASKRVHCITAETWRALAGARGDYEALLTHEPGEEASGGGGRFSRTYDARRLKTRGGRVVDGEIVAVESDGVLFYGPYVALAPGRYVATVNATRVEGPGTLVLRVTVDGGNRVLAQRRLRWRGGAAVPTLRFVVPEGAPGDLEVVCSIKGYRTLGVSGVTIAAEEGAGPERVWSWPFSR